MVGFRPDFGFSAMFEPEECLLLTQLVLQEGPLGRTAGTGSVRFRFVKFRVDWCIWLQACDAASPC